MDKKLDQLIAAVQEAGSAISAMRRQGVTVSVKENHDVLAQADLLANQILHDRLQHDFPGSGWLSEECVDDPARLQARQVWVIDPIDGTREYIAGIPEYAVSAALTENGLPLLACVYNPETNEMFAAARGSGMRLNGRQMHCKQACNAPLTLLASRSEFNRGEWQRFQQHQVKVVGSIAYKLALVAAGHADATFSLGPKHEWDIAAGVLLVQEAGGRAIDKHQQAFIFNQPQVKVNGIIAASVLAMGDVLSMINQA